MNIPPFEITTTIIDLAVKVAQLLNNLTFIHQRIANSILRRTYQIRTVCRSLTIYQNILYFEQVNSLTTIISWCRLINISEFKIAYEIYDMLDELDP